MWIIQHQHMEKLRAKLHILLLQENCGEGEGKIETKGWEIGLNIFCFAMFFFLGRSMHLVKISGNDLTETMWLFLWEKLSDWCSPVLQVTVALTEQEFGEEHLIGNITGMGVKTFVIMILTCVAERDVICHECLGKTKDKCDPNMGRSNLPVYWTIWRQESSCWDKGNSCISCTEQVFSHLFQDQGWSRKQEEVFSFYNTRWDDCRAQAIELCTNVCNTTWLVWPWKSFQVCKPHSSWWMLDCLGMGTRRLSVWRLSFQSASNFRNH